MHGRNDNQTGSCRGVATGETILSRRRNRFAWPFHCIRLRCFGVLNGPTCTEHRSHGSALIAAVDGAVQLRKDFRRRWWIASSRECAPVPFGRGGKPQPAFCVAVHHGAWTSSLKLCVDVLDAAATAVRSPARAGQVDLAILLYATGSNLGGYGPRSNPPPQRLRNQASRPLVRARSGSEGFVRSWAALTNLPPHVRPSRRES